ncbi:DUF6463 family protein [Streptomyces sp. NPDC003036]|uniref:DUF6463 family protein n=1 Tax=Streptomyces sp. NPDC003036 TaxID=3154442 RepID=UPI0033BCC04D
MSTQARGLRLWIPRLVHAAAAAHLLVGAAAARSHWSGIVSEGLWNTVANDDEGRMMALWFMAAGLAFVGLGLLARRSVTTTGALPPELGWILLALGIPVSLLEPVSGGWSLIAIGLLAVVSSRRDRTASALSPSAGSRQESRPAPGNPAPR